MLIQLKNYTQVSMSEIFLYFLFNKASLFIAQPLTLKAFLSFKYKKSCDDLFITCFHEKRIPKSVLFLCFIVFLVKTIWCANSWLNLRRYPQKRCTKELVLFQFTHLNSGWKYFEDGTKVKIPSEIRPPLKDSL